MDALMCVSIYPLEKIHQLFISDYSTLTGLPWWLSW